MQLGMIGLGRMGANMGRHLMKDGHTCTVYNSTARAVRALAADPVPELLFARFRSRGEAEVQNRLLSAMRAEFGGHAEQHASTPG